MPKRIRVLAIGVVLGLLFARAVDGWMGDRGGRDFPALLGGPITCLVYRFHDAWDAVAFALGCVGFVLAMAHPWRPRPWTAAVTLFGVALWFLSSVAYVLGALAGVG